MVSLLRDFRLAGSCGTCEALKNDLVMMYVGFLVQMYSSYMRFVPQTGSKDGMEEDLALQDPPQVPSSFWMNELPFFRRPLGGASTGKRDTVLFSLDTTNFRNSRGLAALIGGFKNFLVEDRREQQS